jgi:hypothetical protein
MNADLFISIHQNSCANNSAQGVEVYYYSSKGKELATLLVNKISQKTGFNNRGAKYAEFYVLTHTKAIAALIECGFISNSQEAQKLANPTYQEKIAEGVVEAISEFLDPFTYLKWTQPYSTNQSSNRTFYFAWESKSSNVVSYDVQYRPHWSSSWRTLYSKTKKTFTYFTGSAGSTYYLTARARDASGNTGAWSDVKQCTIPYDNTSSIFATSGKYWWSVYNSSLYRANSYATTAKNHVFYAKEPLYKVKEVVLIVTKRPNGGKADVYINNRYITTVDFSSSTPKYRVPVLIKKYSSPLPYIWSFKVVTKGKRVEIDGVGVRR